MQPNWMVPLSDNTPLSQISIPGTHDSGTQLLSITGTIVDWFRNIVKCQNNDITTQLTMGIRYLDIRITTTITGSLTIVHDGKDFGPFSLDVYCERQTPAGTRPLTLDDVILDCVTFLAANPSETIIMCVKAAQSADIAIVQQLFLATILANPGRFYANGTIPLLNAVRGRIVLIHRFALVPMAPIPAGTLPPATATLPVGVPAPPPAIAPVALPLALPGPGWFGLDFSAWDAQSAASAPPHHIFGVPTNINPLGTIQDNFNIYSLVSWTNKITEKKNAIHAHNANFTAIAIPAAAAATAAAAAATAAATAAGATAAAAATAATAAVAALPAPPLCLNFASCTMLGYIKKISLDINADILGFNAPNYFRGCVIMDFPSQAVIDRIINDN